MKLTIVLLIVIFGAVFCQPDKTFKEVVTFEKGFRFTSDGVIQTLPYTGGSSGTVNWSDIIGKPLVFPPDLTITNPLYKPIGYVPQWGEIQNKPEEIPLYDAISQLQGVLFPRLTQVQIDALVPVEGLEVYNLTIHAKQYYNGTVWKTIITAN